VIAPVSEARASRSADHAQASAFERTDYWRRSPAARDRRVGHKEWSYFCVFAPNLDLLINFSLMDSHERRPTGSDAARVLVAVCENGDRWDGDVDEFDPEQIDVAAGETFARFGPNRLALARGQYHLTAKLRRRRVAASLTLQPLAEPAIANSVRLSARGGMRWLVVPRLVASGVVEVASQRYELDRCLAYHDRNWGYFDWGGDFAWEWAAILPNDREVPWSLVYMRISDRIRAHTLSQGLIVWRNDVPSRTFHGRDLDVRASTLLRPERILRIPRIMSLACPGSAADVPQTIAIRATAGKDTLDVSIGLHGLAQVAIPGDRGRGVTLLSETAGRAHVSGRIRGEPVEFEGRTLVELNHAAA
jgi:hypothetical protein